MKLTAQWSLHDTGGPYSIRKTCTPMLDCLCIPFSKLAPTQHALVTESRGNFHLYV
jgi:hypothetical protein